MGCGEGTVSVSMDRSSLSWPGDVDVPSRPAWLWLAEPRPWRSRRGSRSLAVRRGSLLGGRQAAGWRSVKGQWKPFRGKVREDSEARLTTDLMS
jgi:hypothetical protein